MIMLKKKIYFIANCFADEPINNYENYYLKLIQNIHLLKNLAFNNTSQNKIKEKNVKKIKVKSNISKSNFKKNNFKGQGIYKKR